MTSALLPTDLLDCDYLFRLIVHPIRPVSFKITLQADTKYIRLVNCAERPSPEPLEQGVLRRGVAARHDLRTLVHRRRRVQGTLVADAGSWALRRGNDARSPWLADKNSLGSALARSPRDDKHGPCFTHRHAQSTHHRLRPLPERVSLAEFGGGYTRRNRERAARRENYRWENRLICVGAALVDVQMRRWVLKGRGGSENKGCGLRQADCRSKLREERKSDGPNHFFSLL
jgi:hypothetical protein